MEFLRQILRDPLKRLQPISGEGNHVHHPLERWSLDDLERFLTELWMYGPQPPGQPGPLIRQSVRYMAEESLSASEASIMVCPRSCRSTEPRSMLA